jgi:hypothetical protein
VTAPPAPPHPSKRPDPRARQRKTKLILAGIAGVFLLLILLCANLFVCIPAWVRWGIVVGDCPAGKPVPEASLEAYGLRRGQPGSVYVNMDAVYSRGDAADDYRTALRRFSVDLFLVDASGEATELKPEKRWRKGYAGNRYADIRLPAVPDGDYTLRAEVDTPLGETVVEAALPIYAPALVHLATDRPLYKPGQTIKYRAAVLNMKDLAPIDQRPGTFVVRSPNGEVLLEEKVAAGPWGVAAGDFPLASDAPVGSYGISWVSGDASDTVQVAVEPFTLPRFEVKLSPAKPWFEEGDVPSVEGTLRYRSGAPVADARVDLRLLASGASDAWPPPNDWLEPHVLRTDRDGAFSLELDPVPEDLVGKVVLPVVVQATDAAGERVQGGSALILSEDAVIAEVETELQDGLVPDFNNRVYLRVTRPDGKALPGSRVTVRRAWDPADEGVSGRADADAVAAVQLDPGQPVSVVIPPLPYRPPPPSEQRRVFRTDLKDLFGRGGDPSLDERVILDRWDRSLEPCAELVESGSTTVRLGVALGPDGGVRRVVGAQDPAAVCVAKAIQGLRGPAGTERLYSVTWRVDAAPGAVLEITTEGVPGIASALSQALEQARRSARPCVAAMDSYSTFPSRLHWRLREDSEVVETRFVRHPAAAGAWSPAALQCVQARFGRIELDGEAPQDAEGVVELRVRPDPSLAPPDMGAGTVRTAYELEVEVAVGEVSLGTTKVVVDPGAVPNLRLRPEDPVLAAGDELRIKLLRGPDFYGELPDEDSEIPLLHGYDEVAELAYDEDDKIIHGTIPAGVHGLLTVSWAGYRAVVLVPRSEELAVTVEPGQAVYRPGELASLGIKTTAGTQGTAAAVSLFGVDEALSQLAPLLSPDDWGRITVRATVDREAFDRFDARALLTGRIAGDNAVLATLQRIADIPATPAEAEAVDVSGATPFDPVVPLAETFYELLSDARLRVSAWEEGAPEGELMTPERMVDLWNEMLKERTRNGQPVEDAYGRALELHRLPSDLLELADPRLLVADKRRLPEDVENWQAYVWENAS